MIKSAGILLFASVMLLLLVIPFSGEASQLGFPDSDGQLVRIGVLAKRGSEECLQNWGPTADYLSRKIENFRFQIVPLAFKEVVPSVQAKEVDFVIVNSSIYVELQTLFGAARIATMKGHADNYDSTVFGGVIFTRADRSDIESINDLKGKSFMGVDETSLGGWRAAWRELHAKRIDPYKDFSRLLFSGTHDDVVYAVRDGKVDAGTVATSILEQMTTEGKIEPGLFRVINAQEHADFRYAHSTQLYPNWPFAKLEHTSNDLAEKIVIALLAMPRDGPAAGVGGWTVPLDYGSVKECLKELRIGIYKDFGKITVVDVLSYFKWQIIGALLAITGLTGLLLVTLRFNHDLRSSKVALQKQICEREHAEAALKQISEQNELILLSAEEGILGIDQEGKVTFANPAAGEILGYEKESLIGKDLHQMIHHSFPDGTHYPVTECPMWRCLQSGAKSRVRDEVLWKKDGTNFPAAYSSAPIMENGQVVGAVVTFRDISVRKRAEEALRQSERGLRRAEVVASFGNWEFIMGCDKVNASKGARIIFGVESNELSISEVRTIPLPEYRGMLEKALYGLIDEGKPYNVEFKIRRPTDGKIIDIHSIAEYSPEKEVVFGVIHDITHRKQVEAEKKNLEAQLFQAQKMESVGRLAGGVAHDFNNMLGVIIGRAELALNTNVSANELQHGLKEILNAGLHSADLTRQLLAFARKQTAVPKVLDLNDTISGMLKMLKRLIGEDVKLLWAPGPDLWKVKIDPSQVDQIIANLAVNARDAISGVGAITMITGNVVIDDSNRADQLEFIPGEYVRLTVNDTGTGMSQEVRENIFEPFFTTKELGKGTGLGLSTVYGIVKQNDGFIDVASEPGKGTTFKIYLPRFKAEAAQVPSEEITVKRPTGKETILLVEDDEAVLNLSKMILEKLGYTVLVALTPVQAIHLVKEHPGDIHLLMTDVVMPEMNGRELAEQLSAVRPNLKCLYMSGYTADVIARRGILDEKVNFIQKPFGNDDLATKVRQVLDRLE